MNATLPDIQTAGPLESYGLAACDDFEEAARESTERSPAATIRVLHLINGEHYSGAERVQDLLAKCLPAEGFNVGFACVKPDRFPQMRESRDAPLYEVPMKSALDLRAAGKIARIIRDEDYRIIHCHTPRTAMIGRLAAARAGVPMIYHVHSPTSRDSTRRLRNWLNTKMERWSLRRAEKLIAVSASLGRHMQAEGFDPQRITVVPNGVPQVAELPQRSAPSGVWTLGAVALFRPRKGMEVLLDAIADLHQRGVSVELRAVGPFETADYERDIKGRVSRLGIEHLVHWIGFTRDVDAELDKMDLFVLPSLFGEGLPMVVLEAMAAGIPVVGTDVEGVPEAIRDGLDGVIAKASDADDLARSIRRIIDGQFDWSQLRHSAIQRHAHHFSDRSMAHGVAAAYREVLCAKT